jgi:hypothetical protein
LEGRNSREVLDFNLYLSPYDVWTGAVYRAERHRRPANISHRRHQLHRPGHRRR